MESETHSEDSVQPHHQVLFPQFPDTPLLHNPVPINEVGDRKDHDLVRLSQFTLPVRHDRAAEFGGEDDFFSYRNNRAITSSPLLVPSTISWVNPLAGSEVS